MAYIGNDPQNQGFTPAIDYFNGDGVTVTFTLSRPVASVAQVIVAIDNVIQNPSTAFSVSGNSITFTSAPLSGTNNIWVEYTSLITTYAAISQDPSVIGDISATGGYLAEGDFGNTFIDGTIVDYVTGTARITTGPSDAITFYNGGTSGRTPLLELGTTGNINIPGTGKRITGDFSNATVANRVLFQTSTANNATRLNAIPNGTSQICDVTLWNNSDPTNAANARMFVSSSAMGLVSQISGSGTYLPIAFDTGGSERLRIDTSGNVGIGTSTNLSGKLNFDTTDRGETINLYSSSDVASRSGIGKYTNETRSYCGAADSYTWRTGGPNGTERMRLNSSGAILLGTTSTSFSNTNYGALLAYNASSFITVDTAAPNMNLSRNNNGDIFAFYRAGSQRGWISVETTGTTFGNLSDRRAKENFTPSPPALTKLENVEIVSFDWKEGGHTEYGTVAQDLAAELPFAVTVGDDGEEVIKPWGVDYSKVVPVLIKAIQELSASHDALKATVDAQAARIAALEAK